MRELTESEMKTLFDKVANYTGRSLTNLIAPPSPDSAPSERFVFRLHESRVYYLKLALANLAVSVARENLLSLGTCLGKFTKTGKFRLHITALDIIAPHARYKIWIKPNGEMPFLVGYSRKCLICFYHGSGRIFLFSKNRNRKTSLPISFERNYECHSIGLSNYFGQLVLMLDTPQYGGNIVKAHIGRWSEDCPEHQAVVVYSMDDTPLVSRSTS